MVPAEIRPVPAGASLTGETPCPATDGSQERTTSFEQPPELCIDPNIDYEVQLTTALGDVVVLVDPMLDEEAANLMRFQRAYEANARYFTTIVDTLDVLMNMVR